MTININNLELALSQKASAASTEYELLVYTKAIQLLKNQAIFTSINYASLPSAASNIGKLYFIEDIETVVWSDGTSWLRLYDKSAFSLKTLWAWGAGSCGNLGDGTTENRCSAVQEICSATDWCQISGTTSTFGAIKTDGSLWTWGRGSNGHLGDGTAVNKCSPVREFCSATDWCFVSVGQLSAQAIKKDGSLWGWGNGSEGALGDGTTVSKCSPVQEFCSSTDWCTVSKFCTTSAIKTDGSLWSWGRNSCITLGDGTSVSKCSPVREFCSATNWCLVSVGPQFAAAIKTSGELWSWGIQGCGSLGDGTTVDRCSPVREFCSATNWCLVSMNNSTRGFAIKSSGELWVWGNAVNGQLGDGTGTSKCSPVREFCSSTDWCTVSQGSAHGLAIKTSGELWAWGAGSCGRLGDGTAVNRCSPVREFYSATNWFKVSSGGSSSVALRV